MSDKKDGRSADQTEQGLVERLQNGDNAAAQELYLHYYERLRRFAYSYVRSREAAEEIVQDTFLALLERRESLALHEGLRAYLYAVVRNRALKMIDHDRVVDRAEATATQEETAPGMGARTIAPDERMEADALAAAIVRAIATLPERRRAALTLRWRHQLPYADIARIMGTSVAAATIQVARARETIAEFIKGYTDRQ
jgi:RNA polymerase sigma-70 factor (ECF subfamily)